MSDSARIALMDVLLSLLLDGSVIAPDAEAGIAELQRLSGGKDDAVAWHETVAQAVAAGYVRDPVVLSPGALQCHWHLVLTPKGFEAASPTEGPSIAGWTVRSVGTQARR